MERRSRESTPYQRRDDCREGAGAVDFGALARLKTPLLRLAAGRHRRAGSPALGPEGFAEFSAAQAAWLEPYAWFRALKDYFGGRAWWEWPEGAQSHGALSADLRRRLGDDADAHRFCQYAFFTQWRHVRAEAARRGIGIIGDIPIFVAADSADAWVSPGLFELGADGGGGMNLSLPSSGSRHFRTASSSFR